MLEAFYALAGTALSAILQPTCTGARAVVHGCEAKREELRQRVRIASYVRSSS